MILTIDIGNTNSVIGLYDKRDLIGFYRLSSRDTITIDEIGFQLKSICDLHNLSSGDIEGAAISSVVPSLTASYNKAISKYYNIDPLVLTYETECGLIIDYDIPNQVGADRIADAVAAYDRCGGPTIIVDFGTAITVDVVSRDGRYLGGAIAPGVEASLAGLSKKAAQLFQVPLNAPSRCLGKNTVESIQAGIVYGTVGLIDELVGRITNEMGEPIKKVIATGGFADMVFGISKTIEEIIPTLTLEGLNLIYYKLISKT